MDDLRNFARYFRPYKISLIVGVACILAGVIFNVTIPIVVGGAIDQNWTSVTWGKLTIAALKVLGLSAMSGFFLFLQRRIASNVGHLSNRECGLLVRESITPRLKQIVLAHLSENNNTPRVAYDAMRAAIKGTAFRGALIPALQDGVVGPFAPRGTKSAVQLSLGL